MQNWYQLEGETVLTQLETDRGQGLSGEAVAARQAEYGPNELVERGGKSPWQILWEQIAEPMIVLLIVAAVVSGFLGDLQDTIAILAIVILNAALGFRQEYKAEKAMAALKKLAVPTVKVRREGRVAEVAATELVPGDLAMLEAGDMVPADGRLLQSANLRVEEAALTGESEPVEKDAAVVYEAEKPLGDRRNMAYMGTVVTYGRGELVITATGMATELGHIADMIQTVKQEPTPLQRRLSHLGRILAGVALAIVAVIFLLGALRGDNLELLFLTAVSLAVAAVPEGLPAVVTIALALGAQRMLKREALIRKLPAVETLGSVTVICSDKTGTLTQNQMTVTVLDVAGLRIDMAQAAGETDFELVTETGEPALLEEEPDLSLLLTGGALCNDALLDHGEVHHGHPTYRALGDPTEGALVLAAARVGLLKPDLEKTFPRIAEFPFDSARKRMTTVHQVCSESDEIPRGMSRIWAQRPDYVAVTKGSVDGLLRITSQVWVDDAAEPINDNWRERIMANHDKLAAKGMRILGVAVRALDGPPAQEEVSSLETELTFVGLVGMIDPPRPEVEEAVKTCLRAGIRPVMITGDHPLTARHIAGQLHITDDDRFLTGQDLDELDEAALEGVVEDIDVYARVSPEHKLRLVDALQRRGHIAAMTGDGVNDAPALKKSDIGVAMGITGTDVSKEAADMILRDDNFATIVAAVEEGRVIYDNIRKFIKYLLSSNSGEIWVMLLGPLLGTPLPLLPLQILWMNLVTDGLPALALGVEPGERNVMQRPPHPPGESIFSQGVGRDIIWIGVLMGSVSLGVGLFYWQQGQGDWHLAQTALFTTLTLSQIFLALSIRSDRDSFFSIPLGANKALLGSVILTVVLQLAVIYVPFMQNLFGTYAMDPTDLSICLAASTILFWGYELKKWLMRRRK